ncbi:MAG: CHASE2 domain-containing protein [bacterium]|jgi:serine/threonine-protein kinase
MLKKYSPYTLCLLISILVVALYVNDFGPLLRLEWKIQDLMYTFRGDPNFSSDIVVVSIDDTSLAQYGSWPWPRDLVGDLVAAVGSGQPKTILLDMLFEPSVTEDTSGRTTVLANQLAWLQNVIVPYEISRGDFTSSRISNPKYLYNSSVVVDNPLGVLEESEALIAQKVFLPPEPITQYAAGLGFKFITYDRDRKVRWTPLVMTYDGYYYPSAQLLAAAHYLGLPPSNISVKGGEEIKAGGRVIPTNSHAEMFINYNKPRQSFGEISAADIFNEKYDLNNLKGKLVVIAVNARTSTDYYQTPVSRNMASAELTANILENIAHSNHIKRLDSSPGTDMIVLFALGGIFAFILPRVSLLYRAVIIIITLFLLANLNFILFNSLNVLTRSLYIGLQLILLAIASPILDQDFLARIGSDKKETAKGKPARLPKIAPIERKPAEANGRAASSHEAVKSTTEAIEKTRSDHRSETKTAMTDFGGSKTFQAETVKAEMPSAPPPREKPKPAAIVADAAPPIEYNNRLIDDEPSSEPEYQPAPAANTPTFGFDSGQLKNLGRYKVVGELGKGAMGTVYKGIDPAINRNVALKTIRLDFVHDPEELAELKERLFREARAAGMLSHPNIVTIYDVGTESNLHYIAMEFLEGQTLESMIRKKVKFNYRIIAQIISQICGALDYAHGSGIVHRDIKPANIMVLSDYKVKVMDFGIARVDSSSMTRTGIAMGTPNYISPEQLQGRPVDHRTDIFSLGVMMYEMLLHRRPFRGENLTSLIYNIVNTEPELPSTVDKSIPLLFDRVIEKALRKNPEERYQRAGEIALALADFIESFGPKRSIPV